MSVLPIHDVLRQPAMQNREGSMQQAHGTGTGNAMKSFHYTKWDPNGNTTLFFPDDVPASCRPSAEETAQALACDQLNAEQAGFAGCARRHLRMAGGEFCVNATLAFGAHLDRLSDAGGSDPRRYAVTVSGWPGEIGLAVKGGAPLWQVAADLTLPRTSLMEAMARDIVLVRLPGISHLLVHTSSSLPESLKEAGLAYLTEYKLLEEDAAGVIFWKETEAGGMGSSLSIWPVVRVRAVNTLYEETSCGSGSLALACLKYLKDQQSLSSVLQPGGARLGIELAEESEAALKARVSGQVRLVEEGDWKAG